MLTTIITAVVVSALMVMLMWPKQKTTTVTVDVVEKEQVKCEECMHYVDKVDASVVKLIVSSVDFSHSNITGLFYCPQHKRPYETKERDCYTTEYTYYNTIPEHKVEVTEKGKEIKEKK